MAFDLYDAQGELFKRCGEIIKASQVLCDAARLSDGLFFDPDQAIANGILNFGEIQVRALCSGMSVPCNLYDSDGMLLVTGGATITDRMIDQFKNRSVRVLRVKNDSPRTKITAHRPAIENDLVAHLPEGAIEEHEHTPFTRKLDQVLSQHPIPDLHMPESNQPQFAQVKLSFNQLKEELHASEKSYVQAVDKLTNISIQLNSGRYFNVGSAKDILKDFVSMLGRDPALLQLASALHRSEQDFLYEHSVNVAMLTMSVTARLGYQQHQVIDAGVGALFQDVGMLRVPDSIRLAPRALTEDEWFEVQRHPIFTIDTLDRVSSLTQNSLIVSYQVHERCDSSGYPRKRAHRFIHPLARIVSAADMYCAITSPRPHRKAGHPYQGMTALLQEAQAGKLDRNVIKAFLDTLSLFPVGSHVLLSDGTMALVIRANPGYYKTPVVVPLDSQGLPTDIELNLAKQDTIFVKAIINDDDIANTSVDSLTQSPASPNHRNAKCTPEKKSVLSHML